MLKYDITSTWQKVFDGSADNVILQSDQECMIYFGGSVAPTESPAIGINLKSAAAGRSFYGTGLTGVNIWMKKAEGFSGGQVVVGKW